ncbi:MAG: hypothetical protein DRI48_11290 [Chloroflexi bacterium]|nr:MAG: hypothetical protein DRI48_11290 [Chloroflexota bacterium]
MRRIKLFSVFVLLALLLSVGTGAVTTAQDDDTVGNEVVFSVPIGSGPGEIGYEGLSIEMLPWGPTALAVGEDGTFYIVDGANNRIQRYDATGSPLSPINFSDEIIGVIDVEAKGDNLVVLDIAAMTPAVRRLTMDGTLVQSYPIPKTFGDEMLWEGVSGIHIGPGGEVYVVVEYVRSVLQLTDQMGAPLTTLRSTAGFQDTGGRTYSTRNAAWSVDPHTGGVLVRDPSGDVECITIQVPHTLAGLRYLQAGRDGSFFIVVEELTDADATIRVGQTVHHYDSEGNLLGQARIPLDDFYVLVENGIAVGPDGNVYALVPKQDRVEIQRLTFGSKLEPIPGEEPVVIDTSASTGVGNLTGTLGCRSRTSMINVANNYINNLQYLSSVNIDGACEKRTKPRYLAGRGHYESVAYDAGGWDTREKPHPLKRGLAGCRRVGAPSARG